MKIEKIYNPNLTPICYFRTAARFPYKKVLLQITEKCNMHCAHCFVSSSSSGNEMSYRKIQTLILPKLLRANVTKVTLTGGEPFLHPKINEVVELLASQNIAVSICTNASLINDQLIEQMCGYKNVHFNVSLDGFSNKSHGKFRGDLTEDCFSNLILNIRKLGEKRLLNGILVTPNIYSSVQEYIQLCEFATEVHAKYVLFNPLSEFGRGQNSKRLAFSSEKMAELKQKTQKFNNKDLEIVYIRFPNDKKPLGQCPAGKIIYVFTDGAIAYCPYMVFASNDKISKYNPETFIVGNIFDPNCDINEKIRNYCLPYEANKLNTCPNVSFCTKGCMAVKITKGLLLSDCDYELCPIEIGGK